MPDSTTNPIQPLEGKTSIDKEMFFEPELLSYEAARRGAVYIADKLSPKIGVNAAKLPNIAIVDEAFLADLANLEAVYLMLDGLKRDYEALAASIQPPAIQPPAPELLNAAPLATPAVLPALAALTSGLNATLGLLSLFREDTEFHGRKTSVDPTAFQLMLAGKLKAKHGETVRVMLPRLLTPSVKTDQENSLRARLAAVHEAKQEVWDGIKPMVVDLARLEADLDAAARAGDQAKVDQLSQQLTSLRRKLDPIANPLSRLDAQLSELETQWQRIDEKTGLAPLARLLRAEAIRDLKPHYVYASVVSAGGSYRIRRSLWRTLFCGDGLSFSGGVIVMWALLGSDGSIHDSGAERHLMPFQRFPYTTALEADFSVGNISQSIQ